MITFNTEQTQMPGIDQTRIQKWVRLVAHAHGKTAGDINYVFVDDERILEVNRQFLSHDYYTDIITFDYFRGQMLRGDMVISLETVASNARQQGAPYMEELWRVIIHGVLHRCGINDKGPGEREVMEAHENAALEMLHRLQYGV